MVFGKYFSTNFEGTGEFWKEMMSGIYKFIPDKSTGVCTIKDVVQACHRCMYTDECVAERIVINNKNLHYTDIFNLIKKHF